jgi:hypothetical protein
MVCADRDGDRGIGDAARDDHDHPDNYDHHPDNHHDHPDNHDHHSDNHHDHPDNHHDHSHHDQSAARDTRGCLCRRIDRDQERRVDPRRGGDV